MSAPIRNLNSPELLSPKGHYSHITIQNDTVYLAGQLPVHPDGTIQAELPFADQVHRVLANLEAALNTAGSSKQRLIFVTVYVTDITNWATFDEIYSDWLGQHRPARMVGGVSELHFGSLVEVSAIAAL